MGIISVDPYDTLGPQLNLLWLNCLINAAVSLMTTGPILARNVYFPDKRTPVPPLFCLFSKLEVITRILLEGLCLRADIKRIDMTRPRN